MRLDCDWPRVLWRWNMYFIWERYVTRSVVNISGTKSGATTLPQAFINVLTWCLQWRRQHNISHITAHWRIYISLKRSNCDFFGSESSGWVGLTSWLCIQWRWGHSGTPQCTQRGWRLGRSPLWHPGGPPCWNLIHSGGCTLSCWCTGHPSHPSPSEGIIHIITKTGMFHIK